MKIFLLIIAFSFSALAAENSVVAEIQKSFASMQSIETSFDQVIRSTRFGEKKANGKLFLVRPSKMLWDYESPKGKIFAADGKIITLYDPAEKQALVSPQPQKGNLPTAFSFLMGQGKLEDYFTVENIKDEKNAKGQRQVTLVCKPKKDMEFTMLELVFVWDGGVRLLSSTTKDVLESENEITFHHMKINPAIPASKFDVKIPEGTPIVTSNSLDL